MTKRARLVLVIDDDEVDRKRIVRSLGHQYAICEAATARVGLDMARRLRPGCVLLDYRLSDADGLEVLEDLVRGDFAVVVLTGQGDEDVAVGALKAGALDYLRKDGSDENVREAVHRAVERTLEKRRFDVQPAEIHGFEELASTVLRPRISAIELACADALRLKPGLESVLEPAVRSLAELDDHVRGLTSLATADRLCERKETLDLAEVADRVRSRLEDASSTSSVTVDIGKLPIVNGSPEALETLLFEIVHEACAHAAGVDAKGDDPKVVVWAELKGSTWQLHVQDTGLPPKEHELSRAVFIPYRRGTGRDLAYSLAARIVALHEGDIWFEPRSGDGCHLVFTLPFTR